jgi:UDP-GlcNAc:undecaprenyl-phosphate/decaprenyl-phosphate GlcNAc-1-phosphate transferase
MKSILLECGIVTAVTLLLTLIIIPILSRHSVTLGLTDKPNHRKLHANPIPVIGGIAIVISTTLALFLSPMALQLFPVIPGGCLLLFVVGVWDDRENIPASYRLLLQLLCAAAVAGSGVRLSSLYGLLGIVDLPVLWQYIITIILITGVTNAFNLIDGIDGLAGGLALINLLVLSLLSFILQQYALFILFTALTAAIIAFLKSNLHPAKIFMGDGGSLMLGFLMATAGILLIETSNNIKTVRTDYVIVLCTGMLLIPVFDSLRVYLGRIKRGSSPFAADKTHLHHLLIHTGLNHRQAARFIHCFQLLIILSGLIFCRLTDFFSSFIIILLLLPALYSILRIHTGVVEWTKKIRKMEESY